MGDIGTKIDKFIEIFINNRGYVKVLEGLKNTLIIAVIGLVIGVVIGTLIAMVRVIPKYKRLPRVLDAICRFYVGLFRGTPMVVQLLVFYYVLLPLMDVHMTGVQVSIMVFGLNSGAYISEIMRSGILSVDPGQMEGGRSLGLSYVQTMKDIILPQAIKNILPALGNEFIVLIKETSILGYVAIVDLTKVSDFVISRIFEALAPLLGTALIYYVIVKILTLGLNALERRLRQSDRR